MRLVAGCRISFLRWEEKVGFPFCVFWPDVYGYVFCAGGVMRCSGGVEGMRGEASATNAMSLVHGGVSGGR